MTAKPCCKNKNKCHPNNIDSFTSIEIASDSVPTESTTDETWMDKLIIYYPLLVSFMYVFIGAIIIEYPYDEFDGRNFVRSIMGLMLLVFSYLKMLNPGGFIMSFQKYDYLASKCIYYGYLYPIIEALLGIFYLINIAYVFTNTMIIILFSINLAQVYYALRQGKELECACLGSLGFKLPLSKVTIIEDVTMILMAIIMLSISN